MAGDTTTTQAAIMAEVFRDGADVVWRDTQVLNLFGAPVDQAGGLPQWVVHYAGQSVDEFSEGTAAPAAVGQSYLDATGAWRYFRVTIEVTGHARDRVRASNAVAGYRDAVSEAMVRGQVDLVHGVATALMDTNAGGLLLAIDSTGTYAGISRSAYTWWASYEASGASLTESILETMFAALEDQPRVRPGMAVDTILCPRSVGTVIKSLGHANVSASLIRGQMGAPLSLGYPTGGMDIHGIPVTFVPTMASGTLVAFPRRCIELLRIRDFEMKPLGSSGDADLWQASCGFFLRCGNPRSCGKLTAIT